MAPSHCIELAPAEQQQLLVIARGSIAHHLQTGKPLAVDPTELTGVLAESHGNFVTLTQNGALRGCIGSIRAAAPLAQDIALTACNAAFKDSRFAALGADELDRTAIDISVLSEPEPIPAASLTELLGKIRPHKHGLIVAEHNHRATLLPKVWEKLPDPRQFIVELMNKAGLPPDYWSNTIRFYGYEAMSFSESPASDTA